MNKKQKSILVTGAAIIAGAAIAAGSFLWLNSRRTIPEGAIAVTPFEVDRYLGKWHEIARLDNRFEKGLQSVTAEYAKNADGSVRVVNRGFDGAKKEWKQAVGKAKFVDSPEIAKLKVSFFGPFYSGYNVIALDENYSYALVVGKNLQYLWILSREMLIPENIKKEYIEKAAELGVNTDELIWVEH